MAINKNLVSGAIDLGAPNLVENDTGIFMQTSPDVAWGVGANPVGKYSITQAIGNGQLGVGVKAPALDVATPLVLPPAVIVVLQVPAMYDANTDGHPLSAMGSAIKDIFESHAKAVSNIDIEYTLDANIGELPLHDGQTFSAPGKTKRNAVTPSFTFTEVTGNLYWNIIRKWITDINNPDTYAIGANVHITGGWTMSAYSMTIAVIQPDVTGRPDRIIDASIICNMFPQGTGGLGAERTIAQMKAGGDRAITFSGIIQHNAYTKQLGRLIMEKLAMHTLDFDWAPPQRDIWTKTLDDIGLGKDVELRGEFYPRGAEDANYNKVDIDASKNANNRIGGITDQFADAARL